MKRDWVNLKVAGLPGKFMGEGNLKHGERRLEEK